MLNMFDAIIAPKETHLCSFAGLANSFSDFEPLAQMAIGVFTVGLLNAKGSSGLLSWYANSCVGHTWALVIAASHGTVARQLSDILERDI